MWKALALLILLTTAINTYLVLKYYKANKIYYKQIDIYINDLKENLTNEGVFRYLSNINNIPKISFNQLQSDTIREIYIMLNKNSSISDDLKLQLRLALSLNGIDKF
jgi:hypothetical protein